MTAEVPRLSTLCDANGLIHYVFPKSAQYPRPVLICLAPGPIARAAKYLSCYTPDVVTCLWCLTLQTKVPE